MQSFNFLYSTNLQMSHEHPPSVLCKRIPLLLKVNSSWHCLIPNHAPCIPLRPHSMNLPSSHLYPLSHSVSFASASKHVQVSPTFKKGNKNPQSTINIGSPPRPLRWNSFHKVCKILLTAKSKGAPLVLNFTTICEASEFQIFSSFGFK